MPHWVQLEAIRIDDDDDDDDDDGDSFTDEGYNLD